MRRSFVILVLMLASAGMPLDAQPKITTMFQVQGHRVRWTAPTRDGNRIYYDRDTTEVFVYDRRTGQHQRVFGGLANDAEVSAAGDRLVFVRAPEEGGEPHVWTMQLDTRTGLAVGNARRVSMTTGHFPSFSPDGRSIAFSAGPLGEVNDLVVVPTAGGPERVIVRKHGAIVPVRWAPDGRSIVYGSNMNTKAPGAVNATFRVATEGGTPQRVVDNADWGAYPGLSPDGRTLLTWTTGWDTIAVQTADGKRIAAFQPLNGLTDVGAWIDGTRGLNLFNMTPAVMNVLSLNGSKVTARRFASDSLLSLSTGTWSPDGKRLAATSSTPGASGFTIIDDNGGTRRVPTASAMVLGNFSAWSPDGQRIAYKTVGNTWRVAVRVLELATGVDRMLVPATTRTFRCVGRRTDKA
jgi:Tol biopolymer transport system component